MLLRERPLVYISHQFENLMQPFPKFAAVVDENLDIWLGETDSRRWLSIVSDVGVIVQMMWKSMRQLRNFSMRLRIVPAHAPYAAKTV